MCITYMNLFIKFKKSQKKKKKMHIAHHSHLTVILGEHFATKLLEIF